MSLLLRLLEIKVVLTLKTQNSSNRQQRSEPGHITDRSTPSNLVVAECTLIHYHDSHFQLHAHQSMQILIA